MGFLGTIALSFVAFILGFGARWWLFVAKLKNQHINAYIDRIDNTLVQMKEDAAEFLSLEPEELEKKREALRLLMVSRNQYLYATCKRIKELEGNGIFDIPADRLTKLRQSSDAIFEDYSNTENEILRKYQNGYEALAMMSNNSQELLDYFPLQIPSVFSL